jgi:acetoin utilization protein AcuB
MLVQHWMTKNPITVEADTPFLEARLILKDKRIRHLPVLQSGKLIGVVTDRDLKEAAPSGASSLDVYEMNYLLLKVTVRELIKREPITIRPDEAVERAAFLMHDHKIGCLPVVEGGGRLVGLITETDLLAAIVEILGYNDAGTRIGLEVPEGPQACEELAHLLHDHQMDIRSLLTCAIHGRPGYREFVIRVQGQNVGALADELKAKFGQSVTVLPG